MAGTRYSIEVRPVIPQALSRLEELAGNLLYSWDRRARSLFRRIDPTLWEECEHNPTVFLRRVSQQRFEALAQDADFMQDYQTVLHAFDQYRETAASSATEGIDPTRDLVAYFCMEFGLHESLRLYSGGLGILAGDHCKAASDLGLPFVALGLMYRQGYFSQSIDADGTQHAHYQPVDIAELPVAPACLEDGTELRVTAPFAGREVQVRVWRATVGQVPLLLLDTELDENHDDDRAITYQLYGGGQDIRISQEIVLGIAGVRALRALGLEPTVWHLNEGHPAFSILERCREQVAAGLDFDSALEAVAAATVFTTHTPVPAGHDLFSAEAVTHHFGDYVSALGISIERLLELGASPENHDQFNMTALALRGSRRHNGVSRVHGDTASHMEQYMWPEIPPRENPIRSITNGVHVPTFLAREWVDLFDAQAAGWRSYLRDPAFWAEQVAAIPNHRFWTVRQTLRSHLMEYLQLRLADEYTRRGASRARIRSMQQVIAPENTRPLVIGFARRFATYKRALLVFRDLERLTRLLGDPERPVILLFAGKAHPQDEPGQALIRQIVQYAAEPPLRGRVFFIEGYSMTLARHLLAGVDVWLNTPEFPMEASGTSGQKAAINGVPNLSVLDGWWAEGFDGANGWAIEPHGPEVPPEERDAAEAEELLDLLEYEVIPTWFADNGGGMPEAWIECAKAAMASVLPRFNAQRMVSDYCREMYCPALTHGRHLASDGGAPAQALAQWKHRVHQEWPALSLRWFDAPPTSAHTGDPLVLRVAAERGGLAADEICLECVLDLPGGEGTRIELFQPESDHGDEAIYRLELTDAPNGLLQYRVRAYPQHPDLAHPFETGCMAWL
ncbi:MAG: alpha-glucan family phosphorylase [Halofilum sp. (in: g-proteobacteria)]